MCGHETCRRKIPVPVFFTAWRRWSDHISLIFRSIYLLIVIIWNRRASFDSTISYRNASSVLRSSMLLSGPDDSRQIGPRTAWPRTDGPRGPVVRGPAVQFFKADSWALGTNCPGPNLFRAVLTILILPLMLFLPSSSSLSPTTKSTSLFVLLASSLFSCVTVNGEHWDIVKV